MIAFVDPLPWSLLAPEFALVLGLVAILAGDVLPWPSSRRAGPMLGIVACGFALAFAWPAAPGSVASMLAIDGTTSAARCLLLPVAALVLLAGVGDRSTADQRGAWSMAVVALALGALLAAAAANFLALWLGLELIAMASYALVALGAGRRRPAEAGMKFVLFGGVSSAAMLFGISHVYGLTGHLDFVGIAASLAGGAPVSASLALLLAGVGVAYKLTLVPFHFYAPDVYQGAPPLGIAAVSVLPKVAATAVLVRFLGALPAEPRLATACAWLAAVSVLFAAFTALVQRDGKRILAFSGIGHGGAVLLAVACGPGHEAAAAAGFYLLVYAAANVGAFVCLSVLERDRGSADLGALAGTWRTRPVVASLLCAFVLSLAGIPPLAGFLGKWAVLQQAFARGVDADGAPALGIAALLFVLATAVAAWSYLLIVRAVLFAPANGEPRPVERLPLATRAVLAACLVAAIGFGLWLDGLVAIRAAL